VSAVGSLSTAESGTGSGSDGSEGPVFVAGESLGFRLSPSFRNRRSLDVKASSRETSGDGGFRPRESEAAEGAIPSGLTYAQCLAEYSAPGCLGR